MSAVATHPAPQAPVATPDERAARALESTTHLISVAWERLMTGPVDSRTVSDLASKCAAQASRLMNLLLLEIIPAPAWVCEVEIARASRYLNALREVLAAQVGPDAVTVMGATLTEDLLVAARMSISAAYDALHAWEQAA